MADTSGCLHQLEGLPDTCGSAESSYVTAPADDATTPSSFVSAWSESVECSALSVEQRIEKSKAHWSTLADQFSCSYEEEAGAAEVSNFQEFMALAMHPTYGGFFRTFYGSDSEWYDNGELWVGEKFAEGGQAEIFHVKVKWWHPDDNERVVKQGDEFVLKVFRKGTFLKHLKHQLPLGLLQYHVWQTELLQSPTRKPYARFYSDVYRGTLLRDGRFAFLMKKEDTDLRELIERNMELKRRTYPGPFSKDEGEFIMYHIALGLDWLHSHDIVHRDLKASNVFVKEFNSGWPKWSCVIADYECSNGVVGTGFFRAPEILQACRTGTVGQTPNVFSRASDVYSYGMTSYEILTGKLPFQDDLSNKTYDSLMNDVINGHFRPEVPEFLEDWKQKLLHSCWQPNSLDRPTSGGILNLLLSNSAVVNHLENVLRIMCGVNFRTWDHVGI